MNFNFIYLFLTLYILTIIFFAFQISHIIDLQHQITQELLRIIAK